MKTKSVTVTDLDGRNVAADLVCCPHCDNSYFSIFLVGGKHQHLQCAGCDQSYCDGSCKEPPQTMHPMNRYLFGRS